MGTAAIRLIAQREKRWPIFSFDRLFLVWHLSTSIYKVLGPSTNNQWILYFWWLNRHADIRDAILTLVGAVREQTGKLERHELRERQLGDALTRSLGQIDSRARGQDKNLENLAILMARIDERLRKMEEMVIQVLSKTRIFVFLPFFYMLFIKFT